MRVPQPDQPRRSLGPRAWLVVAAIVLLVLLTSLRGLALFYTDYLWFQEVGFEDTWRGLLGARVVPALVFTAVFFVVMLVNLVIADRLAPGYRPMGPEDEIIEHYRRVVAPYAGRLRVGVALFFAIIFGSGVSAQWQNWILFRNGVDFGVEDPQFHRDVGFYVFRLPFLRFAAGWTFAALLGILLVTAVFHYVNGGIRLRSPFQLVTPQVKAHLSVILALMAFVKTAQYYLGRFELNFSTRGAIDGASYTDVKAQLPALNFLMIISVAAAVLFVVNIFRRGWVLPVIAVGLWGFISLVVGTIYPAYIQRFQVQPNEFARERDYIARNIEATRSAFALDDEHVVVRPFDYRENVEAADLDAHAATLENVRLWDPEELEESLQALQELFTFYTFEDVDLDRYQVGDQVLPVLVAARELNDRGLPSGTWTNRHLVYTHGYGAVVAAANDVAGGNAPSFLLSGIPPEGELGLEEPGLYFGENLGGFSVVDTKQEEFEPSSEAEGQEATTRYAGSGGVRAASFLRKAALALRFGSWDLFVSGQLDDTSRVIYLRDVRDRVEKAAPFLRFDADPYPVVLEDGVVWVVDGYTTTTRYPYSQAITPEDLPIGSGLDTKFNYVRNSVKATVDAYDGTVRFYVVDEADPVIRAYRKAFPELFSDASEIPEGLAQHFRYPEDLFRAQTEQYATYHMTDPQVFYKRSDLWAVAPEPGASADQVTGTDTATTSAARGNDGGRASTLRAEGARIDPLYLMLQLPGEDAGQFLLTRPFVPINKDNQLSAFVAARSDWGEGYGELVVYEMPDNSTVPSPLKAATQIESALEISRQFTLLDQRGSEVFRGNVQLLPLGDSILYVRPVYVEGRGGDATFPRFRFVAMTYGERSVLATSVSQALDQLFGRDGREPPPDGGEPPPDGGEPPPDGGEPPPGDVGELLARAADEFAAADEALADRDLEAYARHIEEAERLVRRANDLLAGEDGGRDGTTTTTSTAPPTGA